MRAEAGGGSGTVWGIVPAEPRAYLGGRLIDPLLVFLHDIFTAGCFPTVLCRRASEFLPHTQPSICAPFALQIFFTRQEQMRARRFAYFILP